MEYKDPKLVKFCNRQYRLPGCLTLQLINSNYCRRLEAEAVRDVDEGTVNMTYVSENKTTTKKLTSGNTIILGNGAKIKLVQSYAGVFVYCVSMVEGDEPVEPSRYGFKSYNDSYEILDAERFSAEVQRQLLSRLPPSSGVAGIYCIHGPVKYVANKTLEKSFEHSEAMTRDDIHAAYFSKSDRFSINKEYRFVWVPVRADGKVVDTANDTILLNSSSFADVTL